MGNSKSTTVITPNTTVPLKSAMKKSAVPGPVSTYNYYPNPYTPVQYIYLPNPVGSNEYYPPNQFYPPLQTTNNIPEQRFSSHHHYQYSHTPHDHHHHHRHPHHHHRHHHRSQSRIEQERATLPSPTPSLASVQTPKSIVAYNLMSPVPTKESIPPLPPSAQTPKPIPSIVTYKVMSPVPTKEFITPPPPPPPPPPAPSSFIVVKQDETPSSIISKSTIPSLLTSSNRFEKAPPVAINYVSKSPDNHSIHNYEPELLTVVQRSSSRHATSGNRWYDHDYDKRVKSFTFNNVESN